MLTVDVESGTARDVGMIYRGVGSDGVQVVVDLDIGDEDDFGVHVGEGANKISIYIPAERVRALLKRAD